MPICANNGFQHHHLKYNIGDIMNKIKNILLFLLLITITTTAIIFEPKQNISTSQADLIILQGMANRGEPKAQLLLGLAYKNGEYGLTPNVTIANKWIELAAKNGNDYAAQFIKNNNLPLPITTMTTDSSIVKTVWGHYHNLFFFVTSILIIIGYHVLMRARIKQNPNYTFQAINTKARSSWVEMIMTNNDGILAVQTLRNSTMAATFLASTAILLIIGVLNISHFGTVPEAISSSAHYTTRT